VLHLKYEEPKLKTNGFLVVSLRTIQTQRVTNLLNASNKKASTSQIARFEAIADRSAEMRKRVHTADVTDRYAECVTVILLTEGS
jgi:hypothetical protein